MSLDTEAGTGFEEITIEVGAVGEAATDVAVNEVTEQPEPGNEIADTAEVPATADGNAGDSDAGSDGEDGDGSDPDSTVIFETEDGEQLASREDIRAYHEFIRRRDAMRAKVAELAIEEARRKAQAKSASSSFDDAREELLDLYEGGWQAIRTKLANADKAAKVVGSTTATATTATATVVDGNGGDDLTETQGPANAGFSNNSTAQPEDDQSWRDSTIVELGAYGLKTSLIEKLDECGLQTIGQIEDLRAEISLGKAKWPKGIGEAKITAIENAVSEWWAKHWAVNGDTIKTVKAAATSDTTTEAATVDSATVVETEAASPATKVEGEPELAGADGKGNLDNADHPYPTLDQWDSSTRAAKESWNLKRAGIVSDADDFKTPTDSEQAWSNGRDEYNAGKSAKHNPYYPGERSDDWFRGWIWASCQEKPKSAKPARVAKSTEATEAKSQPNFDEI